MKIRILEVTNKSGVSQKGTKYSINIAICQSNFAQHPDIPFTYEALVDDGTIKGTYEVDLPNSLYIDRGRLAFRLKLKPVKTS